ncbi:MAG: hypothetical protein PHR35_02565 [Kiritimatiellae bacterium]|nr:hypothetical protein [Kiritimatiellia bacterium]
MERWMWIDLTGFDAGQPDGGVNAFFDEAGFVPTAMSLLLFSPRFLHEHTGLECERVLPPDCCSYIKPRTRKRARQAWTNRQVKALIDELHRHDIKVYLSIFATLYSVVDGPVRETEWSEKHPELLGIRRNGQKHTSLNALKRFRDGAYYEDFYVARLEAVMRDYGFDGLHGADGYAPPALPIFEADFSDDMVEQFLLATGATLPTDVASSCDGQPEAIARRASWLWQHRRAEWIGFHAARTTMFWRKVATMLHRHNRKIVLNNAWTREPFEALYRYGVDYLSLTDAGIDGFVPETVSTCLQTESDARLTNPLYDSLATVLLMKARTPELPLTGLCCTRDTAENWDNLEHARPMLEREIYSMCNLYRYDGKGVLQRCWAGPFFCLSEDVRASEWQWLHEKWELGFSFNPCRTHGATLVWSQRAFEAQLPDFLATRRWTTHRLLTALLSRGAPVHAVTDVADLDGLTGPLLVLNPHLFPKAELELLARHQGGPIVFVGGEAPHPGINSKLSLAFDDVYPPQPLACRVYGTQAGVPPALRTEGPEEFPPDAMAVPDEGNWTKPLYARKVSTAFLDACAQAISACASPIKVVSDTPEIRVQALENTKGELRLLIANDAWQSRTATIAMGRTILRARVRTCFPLMPYGLSGPDIWEGARLAVKVPMRGMTIVDAELGDA